MTRWRRGWAAAALVASGLAATLGACGATEGRDGAREADPPTAADTAADGRSISRLSESAIARAPAVEPDRAAIGGPAAPGAPAVPAVTAADTLAAVPVTISLLTFGQGDAVWERYGHNAIRVQDPLAGTDVAYNWGEFDFDQPNFIGRFLTGDTKYAMRPVDARLMIDVYARQFDRSSWTQELALTAAQKAALVRFLRWNDTEANRYYRYDYYRDNCSTRVRDVLDAVLGGALRRATTGRPAGATWRSDTRRLNAGDPAIYTGIQLALGRPADRPLDRWAHGYLPVQLMQQVRDVRVPGADGRPVPLVRAEAQLYQARRAPEPVRPPTTAPWYLLGGLALGGTLAVLARGAAFGRGAGVGLGVLGGGWSALVGVLGTLLLLAGTVTRHDAYMGRNLNLLAFNPLWLATAGLVVAAAVRARRAGGARWLTRAARAAALGAALAAVGALVVWLPRVGQGSGELFLLALPAHLGLWWGLRAARRRVTPAA